jgi:hypothetical protein
MLNGGNDNILLMAGKVLCPEVETNFLCPKTKKGSTCSMTGIPYS